MRTTPCVRIAVVQSNPVLGDLSANRSSILADLETAARAGARLVVFPECALSGYAFDSRDEGLAHAEPIPGPTVEAVADLCRTLSVFCVFGLVERSGDRLYNACVLVGPEGLIGSYRKIHLPFMGVDRFADPGDRPLEVLDAGGLRIGMHICYDGTFPEVGRVLTLLGADLLVLPTNFPSQSGPIAEHVMACRSIENTVYSLFANRVGEERGVLFIGRSVIHGPQGETLARAGQDSAEILLSDIDPARARQKRLVRVPGVHEVNRIHDRRPEFYGLVCSNLKK